MEAVGHSSSTLQVGDHVVLGFNYCQHCETCLAGFPGNCIHTAQYNFGALRPDGSSPLSDGHGAIAGSFFGQSSFATHTNVSEHLAVKVPKDLALDVLAPLGCGVMTGVGTVFNVLRPKPGSTIAIFGAGGVGLSALLAARLSGCSAMILIDVLKSRLAKSLALGASHAVDGSGANAVELIREITQGRGVDFAIDAVGKPEVFRAMLDSLTVRGHGALVGAPIPGQEVSLDLSQSLGAGRRVSMVLEGDAHPQLLIPQMAALMSSGALPVDKLITRYPFGEINRALADSLSGDAVKPVLIFP